MIWGGKIKRIPLEKECFAWFPTFIEQHVPLDRPAGYWCWLEKYKKVICVSRDEGPYYTNAPWRDTPYIKGENY